MEIPNELWQRCLSLTRVTAHWHKSRKGALEAEIGAAQTPDDLQRAKRDVERFIEEMEQRHHELGEIAMEVERTYAQVRPKKPGLGAWWNLRNRDRAREGKGVGFTRKPRRDSAGFDYPVEPPTH